MTGRPVLFVINSLAGGGAERVMVDLLGGLEEMARDHPLHLALLDDEPGRYAAPEHVTVHRLATGGSLVLGVARLARLTRRLRPAAVLSFLTRANVAAILAGRLAGAPVVASERVQTASHFGAGLRALPSRALVRLTYPMARRVVAVSEGVAEGLTRSFGVPPDRIDVIHNPVRIDELRARGAEPPGVDLPDRFCVAVGRLEPNKRFDRLFRAYAASNAEADLVVLGEGGQREALGHLARGLGIADRVHMPGFAANPHAVMARAEFYVSASGAEGFPNALVEAMALGLPPIHTDCPSGPAEIIGGGAGDAPAGILTPLGDEPALAAAIDAMGDAALRREIGQRAAARAADFTPERAYAGYRDTLLRAMRRPDGDSGAPAPLRRAAGET